MRANGATSYAAGCRTSRSRSVRSRSSPLCDGWAPLPLDDEAPGHDVDWDAQRSRFPWAFPPDDATSWAWHVHAFLIRHPDGPVLVDTGIGDLGRPPFDVAGRLEDELAAIEVSPESVRHVILTHLHGDHAGAASAPGRHARASRTPAITSIRTTGPSSRTHRTPDDLTGRFAMAGLERPASSTSTRSDHEVAPGSLRATRPRSYAGAPSDPVGGTRRHLAAPWRPPPHDAAGGPSHVAVEPRRGSRARGRASRALDRRRATGRDGPSASGTSAGPSGMCRRSAGPRSDLPRLRVPARLQLVESLRRQSVRRLRCGLVSGDRPEELVPIERQELALGRGDDGRGPGDVADQRDLPERSARPQRRDPPTTLEDVDERPRRSRRSDRRRRPA